MSYRCVSSHKYVRVWRVRSVCVRGCVYLACACVYLACACVRACVYHVGWLVCKRDSDKEELGAEWHSLTLSRIGVCLDADVST
jgi:hypothetical protein